MANRLEEDDATVGQRLLSAIGASVVAALVVNPFDVVKVRQQAQAATGNTASSSGSSLFERWAVASCPPFCKLQPAEAATCGHNCTNFTSTWDGFRKIAGREGVPVLWRGTHTSLMMSVPMVGIYMPIYDCILKEAKGWGIWGPLVAGTVSRTIAVLCVGPMELIRTRQQAFASAHPAANNTPSIQHVARQSGARSSSKRSAPPLKLHTVPRLWTGVTATLARDVPFSALYWGMLEPLRGQLLRLSSHTDQLVSSVTDPSEHESRHSGATILAANMTAGALAGALAAGLTTPLDVVKTRVQISNAKVRPTIVETLSNVWHEAGLRGLFTGGQARAVRAAPACAIVISCYELLKASLQ